MLRVVVWMISMFSFRLSERFQFSTVTMNCFCNKNTGWLEIFQRNFGSLFKLGDSREKVETGLWNHHECIKCKRSTKPDLATIGVSLTFIFVSM